MASFGPSQAPYWPTIDGRRREYLIISEPEHWVSHWEPALRRSRRCGGPTCYQCSVGIKKQLRVVIMCVDSIGRDALIELRERHREIFDSYETTVGLRIELRRSGTAKNSPVDMKVLSRGDAIERNIAALVRSFGLAPLEVPLTSAQEQQGEALLDWNESTRADEPEEDDAA